MSPQQVFEQMVAAVNQHDLEGLVSSFALEYQSEQPFHPERNFIGSEVVRKNYTFLFNNIPDIQGQILNLTVEGTTVWAEVHYFGTQLDGAKFILKGVMIAGIQNDQISWTRLYTELLQEPKQL
jgi:hypothetical protein